MLRALKHLLLAAALLVAWQGALLHPLQHADAHGGLIHLALGHDSSDSGNKHGGPNALCDAVAAVAACIGGANAPGLAAAPGSEAAASPRAVAARLAPPPPYLSQAPPSLL